MEEDEVKETADAEDVAARDPAEDRTTPMTATATGSPAQNATTAKRLDTLKRDCPQESKSNCGRLQGNQSRHNEQTGGTDNKEDNENEEQTCRVNFTLGAE